MSHRKESPRIYGVSYDPESDAAYIYLQPRETKAHVTNEIDHGINADFDKDGAIVGLEILWVRDQVQRYLKLPKPKEPNVLDAFGSKIRRVYPAPE